VPLPVPSVTASLSFAVLLGALQMQWISFVCLLGGGFVVLSETIFKPLPQRDRFFIL
jgi:hypothetical protein